MASRARASSSAPQKAPRDAFSTLRLQTIRSVAASELLILTVRFVLDPYGSSTTNFMRVVAIVYGLFTLTSVDEDTAQWHGLAMTVLAKAFTILRIFSPVLQDEDVVVTMVSYGAHRILPMLAAVFGGVRASIFFTLWAVVETVAAGVYKRVITHGGPLVWFDPTTWYMDKYDQNLIGIEVFYIVVSASIATALQHSCRMALAQLADALEARQRFITNMNHEIRTPLVGVLGMADLLLLQSDLPSSIAAHLKVIHESGKALLAIVNNILDVSKLNAHMMRVDVHVRVFQRHLPRPAL